MQIKVVRADPEPVPPLQYADLKVGEAFTFIPPDVVFIRTSEGALPPARPRFRVFGR